MRHPDLRLVGAAGERIPVDRQRRLELAQAIEDRGAQIGIVILVHVEPGELVQRLGGAIGAVEHRREIDACGVELRRQLERAAQQRLGVARPTERVPQARRACGSQRHRTGLPGDGA